MFFPYFFLFFFPPKFWINLKNKNKKQQTSLINSILAQVFSTRSMAYPTHLPSVLGESHVPWPLETTASSLPAPVILSWTWSSVDGCVPRGKAFLFALRQWLGLASSGPVRPRSSLASKTLDKWKATSGLGRPVPFSMLRHALTPALKFSVRSWVQGGKSPDMGLGNFVFYLLTLQVLCVSDLPARTFCVRDYRFESLCLVYLVRDTELSLVYARQSLYRLSHIPSPVTTFWNSAMVWLM